MKGKVIVAAMVAAVAVSPAGLLQAQSGSGQEVWVGAPFDGIWPSDSNCKTGGANQCSLPYKHWTAYGGQWSVDLPVKQAGGDVFLYVAPENARANVTTKVESIREACTKGRQGGKVVRVGVYVDGTKVGALAYSHLNPTVKEGSVHRWGAKLGTLFSTEIIDSNCWTGPHLHLEVSAVNGFSCYNKDWRPLQRIRQTNFLGFVTGARATNTRAMCP